MPTPGRVRVWYDADGWGVIDSPSTPGGCWAHFSNVAVEGYRSLDEGQLVEMEWESGQQDGYAFRAVRVWPQGAEPYDTPLKPSTSIRTWLKITYDDPAG